MSRIVIIPIPISNIVAVMRFVTRRHRIKILKLICGDKKPLVYKGVTKVSMGEVKFTSLVVFVTIHNNVGALNRFKYFFCHSSQSHFLHTRNDV